jgi:hypothetical protein
MTIAASWAGLAALGCVEIMPAPEARLELLIRDGTGELSQASRSFGVERIGGDRCEIPLGRVDDHWIGNLV